MMTIEIVHTHFGIEKIIKNMKDTGTHEIKLLLNIMFGSILLIILCIWGYWVSFNSLEESIRSIKISDEYAGIRDCWVEATAVRGYHDFRIEDPRHIDPFWSVLPVSSIKVIEYLEDEGGVQYRRYFWGIPLDTKVYSC